MNAWEEQLNKIGKALVQQMRDNLAANGSDLTGKLSNSIGYEVTKDSAGDYTLQSIVPVNEAFNDRVCGWVGTIVVNTDYVLDFCNFPKL